MALAITKPNTIYAIRCVATNKLYVGRTSNLDQRINAHLNELKKGYKGNMRNPSFQQDFDQYGQDAFKVYILERDVPPDMAEMREAYWIAEYRATNPMYGYNQRSGDPPPTFSFADGMPPKPGCWEGSR